MSNRKTAAEKKRIGSYTKSRDVAAKILKPVKEIPQPFFNLTENQHQVFKTVCKWLIDNESLKPLFLPQITRYAVMLDAYITAKKLLDDYGPVVIYEKGKGSNISGALIAVDRMEKQLATIEGKFGLDLKSYGTLKITESDQADEMFD